MEGIPIIRVEIEDIHYLKVARLTGRHKTNDFIAFISFRDKCLRWQTKKGSSGFKSRKSPPARTVYVPAA
jgi:hypothetical protein